MEDKPPRKLDEVTVPVPNQTVSRGHPPAFTGSCDSSITRVTIEVVNSDGSTIMGGMLQEQPPPPGFTPSNNSWTITPPANTLPIVSQGGGNPLRLRVRFYEGINPTWILTTLKTVKFFTTA